MFDRLSYTWSLMVASWDVLKCDKKLLVFPLMSMICCGIVLLSFGIPLSQSDFLAPPARDAATAQQVTYYGLLFLFYVCTYAVGIFFNAGVVACAVVRLEGGEPRLEDGLRAALTRLPQIFGWAVVSATVGLALRMLEDRSKTIGQIVAAVLGTAWSVMTFLVVPVLVVEKKGPFAAAAESTRMLKKTWGEQLMGNFGFGLLFFVLLLPAFALIALGVAIHWAFLVAAAAYVLVAWLVQSALLAIFQSALYLYAREGRAPDAFGTALLSGAMRHR